MRASLLDREITIRRMTANFDTAGVLLRTWADLVTLRAKLVQHSSTEKVGQSGEVTTGEVLFRARYFDGLTVADEITYEGKNYNIKGVTIIGRRRGLEIQAQRIGS